MPRTSSPSTLNAMCGSSGSSTIETMACRRFSPARSASADEARGTRAELSVQLLAVTPTLCGSRRCTSNTAQASEASAQQGYEDPSMTRQPHPRTALTIRSCSDTPAIQRASERPTSTDRCDRPSRLQLHVPAGYGSNTCAASRISSSAASASSPSRPARLKYGRASIRVSSFSSSRRSAGSACCELLGLELHVLVGVLCEHIERRISAARQRELRFGTGDLRSGFRGRVSHNRVSWP